MIPPETVQTILSAARIEDVVSSFYNLKKSGQSLYTACPKCNTKGKAKGLVVTPAKGVYKCFSCGFGGKSPADFLMETQGMSYPIALKWLADKFNIIIEEVKQKGPQKKGADKQQTFRDRQLMQSGLTEVDQQAMVLVDDDTQKIVDTFESGTRDQYGKLVPGDDLIIWYYDLEGRPVMYTKPKTNRTEHLYRVRWQNPDLHRDQHDRPMKYSSPYGSGSHLFIPEEIRKHYKERRVFKRLYIQEGEKKSLKACKHGLLSVGVMGIQNIGIQGKLPYELQLIVQACHIEEVIFVLDSDWDHLSNELKPGQRVDQRPYSFFYAVLNFKDYFKTFVNMGIYLELYFAHINDNDKHDKGIDDLLANTLKLEEKKLFDDIETAINEKDGKGIYIQVNKISAVADLKLKEYWHLHSAEEFAQYYKDELQVLQEFRIGKHIWRFAADGKLEPAQPLQEDEQFWETVSKRDRQNNEYLQYRFKYLYAYNFLKRRGFARIMMACNKYEYCQQEAKVIRVVEPYQIRDYVLEFTKEIVKKDLLVEVMDMLYRNAKGYFGPDSLSHIDFTCPQFESSEKSFQYLYFKNKYWKITADGIEEKPLTELQNYIWENQIVNFDAKYLGNDFITVERLDDDLMRKNKIKEEFRECIGQYLVEIGNSALESHFIQFLWNTGEFFWQKFKNDARKDLTKDTRSILEKFETQLHFVAKMTHIGYLLHEHRDKSCEKAVIAMDGKISEVGDSNGRSGKSLLGMAIGRMIPQAYIGGKSKDLTEDPFLFEEVSEKTKNIFVDDVRANVDFEFFFPIITGRLMINAKGLPKFTLPEKSTPKLYITTNHAINGATSSFRDRQALIAFSDYYSDDYKPIDDFGMNFFEEWDDKQWNLFYNFMAACLQLYFRVQRLGWGIGKSGLISSPVKRLEKRRLRQFVGETFISWADDYFGISDDDEDANTIHSPNLNTAIPRKELFFDFTDKNSSQRKYYTSNLFFRKIVSWCELHGLKINPRQGAGHDGKPLHDKRDGVEYITIANDHFSE